MKITFVGHAAILIETKGLTILSDPWWGAPCFGAQWWDYPLAKTEPVDNIKIDYVYISHGHHDHFHPGTLKKFADSKIIVSSEIGLAEDIRKLGYDVTEVHPDQVLALNEDVNCYILPTHGDDTLMVIQDGEEVCVNANDALHAAPIELQDKFIAWLNEKFDVIDYLFCGYGVASHFPNCYSIPGKDDVKTAASRQHHFNTIWARIVKGLAPAYAFPFAADVVFLENALFYANEPTHNTERPTDYFTSHVGETDTQVFDIAPGFSIANKTVQNCVLREPLDANKLKEEMADEIARANRYGETSDADVAKIISLLEANILVCKDYLNEYEADYSFLISFNGSDKGISITKRGTEFTVSAVQKPFGYFDVEYQTRLTYLRQSLSQAFGSEILFVGSGGIFNYSDKQKAMENLHRELKPIITLNKECPASRYGKSSKSVYKLKAIVKNLLGHKQEDLYDLKDWIKFQ